MDKVKCNVIREILLVEMWQSWELYCQRLTYECLLVTRTGGYPHRSPLKAHIFA